MQFSIRVLQRHVRIVLILNLAVQFGHTFSHRIPSESCETLVHAEPGTDLATFFIFPQTFPTLLYICPLYHP
ncbi:hypothetical protein ACQX8E_15155, partial [Staphylococcus aureus]|uniref:hypothetical protein n=1 Tax=Staphylococcus aureus TaxID=1280 RepID=UPI003D1A6771